MESPAAASTGANAPPNLSPEHTEPTKGASNPAPPGEDSHMRSAGDPEPDSDPLENPYESKLSIIRRLNQSIASANLSSDNLAPQEILDILRETLNQANNRILDLCGETASILQQSVHINNMVDSPKKTEGLALLQSLKKFNKAEAEEAQKNLAEAQHNLSTMEAVHKALLPPPVSTNIEIDETDPVHLAIKRFFKFTTIPVVPGTKLVDWSRLPHTTYPDSPKLDLTVALRQATHSSISLVSVTAITKFLDFFLTFYHGKLVELFPHIAWKYMEAALEPSGLDLEFRNRIESSSVNDRSWNTVRASVIFLTNTHRVRPLIKSRLFALRILKDESASLFIARVKSLVSYANAENMQSHLSELIFLALPEHGQELVMKEFPLGPLAIDDYNILLDFIDRNNSIMYGEHADATDLLKRRWATHLLPGSTSASEAKAPRLPSKRAFSNTFTPEPNFQKKQSSPASVVRNHHSHPANSASCTHILCTSLNLQHLNGACPRKQPNKEEWYQLLKANQTAVDNWKSTGKWPQPRNFSAPVPSSTPVAVAATYISRPTKKQKKLKIIAPAAASVKRGVDADMDIDADTDDPAHDVSSHDLEAMNDASSICKKSTSDSVLVHAPNACAIKSEPDPDNRLYVSVEILGRNLKALVDPGATVSFLDRTTATTLNITINESHCTPVTLANGSHSSMTVTRKPLEVLCNGNAISSSICVMPLSGFDFLIGMDLFNKFGFYIGGASNPVLGPSAKFEELLIEHDTPPEIVGLERPEVENTPEFKALRDEFLLKLKPLLDINASIETESFCTHPLFEVDLQIPPGITVYQKPHRPFPQAELANVQKQLDQWLLDGVIARTNYAVAHTNQLTMSARRDLEGRILKTRLCLDPRNLNSHLLNVDKFPLPLISKVISDTAGHKYFTTLDLRQAFLRSPLTPKSQPLTAFYYGGKQYMFLRAPFGLKPMSSIFQRGMADILDGLDFVAVYIDDIVIYSKTPEEHLLHVQEVLKRLNKHKLIINPEKCHFFCTEIILLGFVINKQGRRINPEKVANVHNWAEPTNAKMVLRYLGMFGYFREYIPLYSTLSAPLDRLRFHKGEFVLNAEQRACFNSLKYLVQRSPVLTFPEFSEPFYVATDASNLGVGSVLYQLPNGPEDETEVHYISFMARSLKKHELNYPAYKKELLGIIYALNQFSAYIFGRHFTLFTDHRPLTYMHTQPDLPTTIANWRETLLKFDFTCVYRPGLKNIIPDALSRAFSPTLWDESPNRTPIINSYKVASSIPKRSYRFVKGKRVLIHVSAITTRASKKRSITSPAVTPTVTPTEKRSKRFEPQSTPAPELEFITSSQLAETLVGSPIDPNAPYVHKIHDPDLELLVPSEMDQLSLLEEIHGLVHLGANAMVEAIHRRGYTWPKLKAICLEWVSKCPQCQHFNIARKGFHPLSAIHAQLPGDHIAIDLAVFPVSEKGNNFALIVVDVCSRFVFLEAIPDRSAVTVASYLFKLFCLIGFPKILQSDNGTEFSNEVAHQIATTMKIDHRFTTPYHPRANGLAERTVRSVKELLQKLLLGNKPAWDIQLPMVQFLMNNRIASLHSSTPFSLFYGRAYPGLLDFRQAESQLMTPEDLDQRIDYLSNIVFPAISEKSKATQKRMIDDFQKTHRITEFAPGSFVMVKDETSTSALDPKYDGPYRVVRRTTLGSYALRDNMGRMLARYYAPMQMKAVSQSRDVPTTDVEHFEVEKILSHRESEGETLYFVKWKGYDDSENSEIPYKNFDSKKTVVEYYSKLNRSNPHVIEKRAKQLRNKQQKFDRLLEKQTETRSQPTSGKRKRD